MSVYPNNAPVYSLVLRSDRNITRAFEHSRLHSYNLYLFYEYRKIDNQFNFSSFSFRHDTHGSMRSWAYCCRRGKPLYHHWLYQRPSLKINLYHKSYSVLNAAEFSKFRCSPNACRVYGRHRNWPGATRLFPHNVSLFYRPSMERWEFRIYI